MAQGFEDAALRQEIVEACRVIAGEGLAAGYGHVSARLPGMERVIITPRSAPALVRRPEDLLVIDLDGRKLSGEAEVPIEVWMHTEVYRSRPEVGAIVRTHGFAGNAWSALGRPLRPVHGLGAFLGAEVPVYMPPFLVFNRQMGRDLAETLGQGEAVLLRGNGQLVVGARVSEACVRAIFLETSARLVLAASAAGQPLALTPEEVAYRIGPNNPYDHYGRAWEYYRVVHGKGVHGGPPGWSAGVEAGA